MKKILYITLLGCMTFNTSCVDLDQSPKSFLTEEEYIQAPKNITSLEKAATGLYNDLWSDNYGFNCRMMRVDASADQIATCPKPNNSLNYFIELIPSLSANDTDVRAIWGNFFKVITSSNKIIVGTPIPADKTEAAKYKAVVGEAYFMRALSYFYLVRIFGDVPLILNPAESQNEQKRTSVAEIYNKAIIPDLQFAVENLPQTSRSGNSGTPNKWAAKICLADVYMNMAGWPLKQGTPAYTKAAELTLDIINNSGLSLTPVYGDLWKEAKKLENNEHIFALIHDAKYNASQYGKSFWPRDYSGSGWADYLAQPEYMNKYPNDDRKKFNFLTEWNTKTGKVTWDKSMDQLPVISKYHDYDNGPHGKSAQSNGLTSIYRYADALLIYAEASNMATGSVNAKALECLQAIQKRSHSTLTTTTDSKAFDKAVLDEKGWEFFAEFRRWFDLVRREKVSEAKPAQWVSSVYNKNKHYYFPIPNDEIQMTGWTNNLGY